MKNLYITYSNQKARDLKSNIIKPLDKVITLENLLLELFESKNFAIIIDEIVGSSIIYNIIQTNNIEYFSYLQEDAISLHTIYNFIMKCKRNTIAFDTLLEGEKLQAIVMIDKAYQEYKISNKLVDIADIERDVLKNWDNYFNDADYNEIYIDSFKIDAISYVKSKYQEEILEKLSQYKSLKISVKSNTSTIVKPKSEVFDNIDEVKTAIRIARKLLEGGAESSDILIVASDIQEYAPLYKLFLDEYEMKGYSSLGTPLSSYHNTSSLQLQIALKEYETKVQSLKRLYKKLGMSFHDTIKKSLKSSISILDEKIGIEITEPNQIIGLHRSYEHIIFIGTDINHFPPKASDNFLYSYKDDVNYFYANDYFKSSQTQLDELKRVANHLYIITASYSGKRELTPSILIDKEFDETIDISDVKSVSQLALEKRTQIPDRDTKRYYESITTPDFTVYDGNGVQGVEATHLSASQINKYISCPLAYLYSNKVKLQAPNQSEEGFDVMEQGSLMHLCYELFGKYIKENSIRSKDRDELYKIMYDISFEAYNHKDTQCPRGKEQIEENIHHQIFLLSLQAGLQDNRDAGLLAKFVNYYIERADELEYFKNTEFEKVFALDSELKPCKLKDEDDKNYFIKGFIDRFDNLEGTINITDYKSKKVDRVDKKKQEEVDTQQDIQLALYILYTKQQYPDKIYNAHLLSFKGNDNGVKFASLSNKDTYNEQYEEDLKKLIFDTKKSIEDGKFSFNNSDEKMCGWCDFKFICHESVLGLKNG